METERLKGYKTIIEQTINFYYDKETLLKRLCDIMEDVYNLGVAQGYAECVYEFLEKNKKDGTA